VNFLYQNIPKRDKSKPCSVGCSRGKDGSISGEELTVRHWVRVSAATLNATPVVERLSSARLTCPATLRMPVLRPSLRVPLIKVRTCALRRNPKCMVR